MLIFWIMVIAAIVLLIPETASSRRSVCHENAEFPALDILKQRYARNDIDRKIFKAMNQELPQ